MSVELCKEQGGAELCGTEGVEMHTARSVSAAPVSASEAASLSSSPSTARSSMGITLSTTCCVCEDTAPALRACQPPTARAHHTSHAVH